MSKYNPLREYLARLNDVVWAAKIGEVEDIIGTKLPRSAREHRTWWANSGGSLVHQNAWLDAGWKVDRTDLKRDVVVFRRLRIGGTGAGGTGQVQSTQVAAEDQARARLVSMMDRARRPVNMTVRVEWTRISRPPPEPCDSLSLPDGPGIARVCHLKEDVPVTAVIDAKNIKDMHALLSAAMRGPLTPRGKNFLKRLALPRGAMFELDVLLSSNAWFLIDGKGRKADLTVEEERHAVAQLLYLQECDSGRGSLYFVM